MRDVVGMIGGVGDRLQPGQPVAKKDEFVQLQSLDDGLEVTQPASKGVVNEVAARIPAAAIVIADQHTVFGESAEPSAPSVSRPMSYGR